MEQIMDDKTKTFEDNLNDAYNLAIDHSIGIVEEYRNAGYDHHALGAIVERLSKLKNKTA